MRGSAKDRASKTKKKMARPLHGGPFNRRKRSGTTKEKEKKVKKRGGTESTDGGT